MLRLDNQKLLKKKYPSLLNRISKLSSQKLDMVKVLEAKSGMKTIQINGIMGPLLIHSKYDPLNEIQRLYKNISEDLKSCDHVVFFGVGLGYHIDYLLESFPKMTFSVYEPSEEIFYRFLETRSMNLFQRKTFKNLYIGGGEFQLPEFIASFTEVYDNVYYFVLPSYEKNFQKELEGFHIQVRNQYQTKLMSVVADLKYEKRWTINSLLNLFETFDSPDLLEDYKNIFKGKPVLLVSAGPSLNDEIKDLQHIKQNKLAYIFVVGSANKTLLKNNIIPDGIFTYDPKSTNELVFSDLILSDLDSIPILYGTSVGFEILRKYKGPKLHFYTYQDTVSSFFLQSDENRPFKYIDDNFSIAIVAYNILVQLECSTIILVGQNFAYRNNQFYSDGIKYGKVNKTVDNEKQLLITKSVDGLDIYTNIMLNQMRLQLEKEIHAHSNVLAINTTKEGAMISGAVVKSLNQVIEENLMEPVVQEQWYNVDSKYSKEFFLGKMDNMLSSYHVLSKSIEDLLGLVVERLNNIHDVFNPVESVQIRTMMAELLENVFYRQLISPMKRTQLSYINKNLSKLDTTSFSQNKILPLLQEMEAYLKDCKQLMSMIFIYLNSMKKKFKVTSYKNYSADEGVFKYTGNWDKRYYLSPLWGNIHREFGAYVSTSAHNQIRFNFYGKRIRIVGGRTTASQPRIRIHMDYEVQDIEVFSSSTIISGEILFEVTLFEGMHSIVVETLDQEAFFFEGIEIDN